MLAGSQTQRGVYPGCTSGPDSFPRICPGTSGWKKVVFFADDQDKTEITSVLTLWALS